MMTESLLLSLLGGAAGLAAGVGCAQCDSAHAVERVGAAGIFSAV